MNPTRITRTTRRAAVAATILSWISALTCSAQLNLDPGSFTTAGIGNPSPAGAVTAVAGGYNVTGGGADIGGVADSFQFHYQSLVGDFDVSIRLDGLSLSDAWSKAGLMARENTTASSRFAASIATPAGSGTFGGLRRARDGSAGVPGTGSARRGL